MTYELNGVEYIPDASGIPEKIKCPMIDGWIDSGDCISNQGPAESCIPARFKVKPD